MRALALALVCLTAAACGPQDRTRLLDRPGTATGSVVADLGAGPVELGGQLGVVLRRERDLYLDLTAARADAERVRLTVRWDAGMLGAMSSGDAMGVNVATLFSADAPGAPVDRRVVGEGHEFRIKEAYAVGTCRPVATPPRPLQLTVGEVLVDEVSEERLRGRVRMTVQGPLAPGCAAPSEPAAFDVAFDIRAGS